MIYNNILETIGKTPLVKLERLMEEYKLEANIYAKIEARNPGGSVKDRAAYSMIKGYLSKGLINKDTILIEPTSGNTGIGLAMVAARMGFRFIVTMPSSMSIERRMLIKAYGAELVLTDSKLGMKGAIERANMLKEEYGNALVIGQFVNLDNPKAHYNTTGPEIYDDLNGEVDILIAGIGTGGTISGISEYIKECRESFKAIGVEPTDSAVISGEAPGAHKIQGIGAGFIPTTLNLEYVDEVVKIGNDEAINMARVLPRLEGILCGISSGAAIAAAIKEGSKPSNKGKNIVVILPDSGERYLSSGLYEV